MKPDLDAIEARCEAVSGDLIYRPQLDRAFNELLKNARQDIPRLLAYIKELEAENGKIRERWGMRISCQATDSTGGK